MLNQSIDKCMDSFTYIRRRKARAMKYYMLLLIAVISVTWACNGNSSAAVATPKPVTEVVQPAQEIISCNKSTKAAAVSDSTLSALLKIATGSGLMEIEAARTALRRTRNTAIQRFAAMMVHNYTVVNDDIKGLLKKQELSVQKPAREESQKVAELGKASNKTLDKTYIDMTIKNHQEMITLFENELAVQGNEASETKTFLTTTLAKLKTHLDAAIEIRNKLS